MPARKKRAVATAFANSNPRRSTRQSAQRENSNSTNVVPNVYKEMLAEVAADSPDDFVPSPRPAKRRKVSVDSVPEVDDLFESPPPPAPEPEISNDVAQPSARLQQVVFDDFEASDDSDVEFEDVELDPGAQSVSEDEATKPKSLQIDFSKSALETPKQAVRRKLVSKAERLMRLDVHKWHLLSLLGHGLHRNSWCSSEEVHLSLKPLVSRKTIKLLHIDESKPLYERNYSFNKGVEEICSLWRQHWQTTVRGMRRAYWREDVDAQAEADEGEDLDFDDFKSAARTCRGSRDLGAQLFTALLRSIAVDARLVFSLQVLPFTGAAKTESPTRARSDAKYIHAPAQNYGAATTQTSPFAPPVKAKKTKKIVDSQYPVYWTEILTPSHTWTPIDPVVRHTISKPKTQFEPPISDPLNSMTYVVAYEDDNSARDVTHRYTQWFNAKTRKLRVEATKGGEQWYSLAMAVLHKKFVEPRDTIEEEELARRINSEGLPHSIQDFKNHPVYVLERHMRANEVLQPKREVGKVNVGTTKDGKIESVYRRQDVYLCRTADAWYRRGRDIKLGEQPLQTVQPKSRRKGRGPSAELSDEENDGESEGVGIYAEYQTDVYVPPAVIDGQIPKNAYGNLDIYVPSMIPPGAVHLSHPMAASAARTIGIDFADAVTGFEFKGRQGTAVINGIVIAQKFTAAVAAIIDGLETLGSEEVQQSRSRILLGVWKRMLQALRVRDRIEAEYGTSKPTNRKRPQEHEDSDEDDDGDDEDDSAYEDDEAGEEAGGGFMLEAEVTEEKVQDQNVKLQLLKEKMATALPDEVVSVPIEIMLSPHKILRPKQSQNNDIELGDTEVDELFKDGDDEVDMANGGFMPDDINDTSMADDHGGGYIPENDAYAEGGGFFADEDDGGGGGFIPEEPALKPDKPPPSTKHQNSNANISFDKTSASRATNPGALTTTNVDLRTKPRASSNTININDDYTIPDVDADAENLHSDIEEDSALQAAIAESLVVKPKPDNIVRDKSKKETENDSTNATSNLNTIQEMSAGSITNEEDPEGPDGSNEPITREPSGTPTSLLSHDPNEDDEDPEWLDDVLE